MERKFGKLVRDNIPKIIRAQGHDPQCSTLDDQGYVEALKKKLIEEVGEFLEGLEIEELADVMEVIGALKLVLGYEEERVEEVRIRKREVNGGFGERVFLEAVSYRSEDQHEGAQRDEQAANDGFRAGSFAEDQEG